MKLKNTSLFLSLILINLTGCATLSGLQTYDLPEEGHSKTQQGVELTVIPLTQDNVSKINREIPSLLFNSDLARLFEKKHNLYRLSSGDVLSIQFWAYPQFTPPVQASGDLTQTIGYSIDSNGYIYLPLIGRIKASDKTVSDLTSYLRAQYARYLKTPDVVIRVLSYQGNRYFVNGQVMKSGEFTLNDRPISVYTALGMAGGINSETGDNTSIQLIRNGQTYNLNILQLENQGYSLHQLLIQPNDTLFVNTRQNNKLYVMGESNKAQPVSLREQGMTLSDVLGESEGINPYSASAARIYVMRSNLQTQTSTIYQLDLTSLGNLALANQFTMQKNDIVYIDSTGLTRWQRVVNQIVPFSTALYSFNQLGK